MTAVAEPEAPVNVPELEMRVPAHALALAWLNVFSAASKDELRPPLNRTIAIEVFNTLKHSGIQLVATDGVVLFRSFVDANATDDMVSEWPEGEPQHKLVVVDLEGFGKAFFATLLSVTNDEDRALEQIHLSTSRIEDQGSPAFSPAFTAGRLSLQSCGQRIDLRLYDGHFPNWRRLELGVDAAERVADLLIAPRVLALLGKLKGVNTVDFAFRRGDEKAIDFTARGILTSVRGLVMPMRREEPKKKAKESEAEGAEETAESV